METVGKAFSNYSKTPFLSVWAVLMYLILLAAFFFTALGLIIAYFISLSVFGAPVDPSSVSSMAVVGVIGLMFVFFAGGLNAALAKALRSAFWREKTSLTGFFSYALDKAPEMFAIMLVRELVWLLACGWAVALYVFVLKDYEFMEFLVGAYVIFMTFVVHMLATPAFIAAGAFGAPFMASFRQGIEFLRKRHIYFIAMYVLFAFTWVLDWVPLANLVSLFFAYPVVYAAMIAMMESSVKMRDDD